MDDLQALVDANERPVRAAASAVPTTAFIPWTILRQDMSEGNNPPVLTQIEIVKGVFDNERSREEIQRVRELRWRRLQLFALSSWVLIVAMKLMRER